jgi:hypothetical protein
VFGSDDCCVRRGDDCGVVGYDSSRAFVDGGCRDDCSCPLIGDGSCALVDDGSRALVDDDSGALVDDGSRALVDDDSCALGCDCSHPSGSDRCRVFGSDACRVSGCECCRTFLADRCRLLGGDSSRSSACDCSRECRRRFCFGTFDVDCFRLFMSGVDCSENCESESECECESESECECCRGCVFESNVLDVVRRVDVMSLSPLRFRDSSSLTLS